MRSIIWARQRFGSDHCIGLEGAGLEIRDPRDRVGAHQPTPHRSADSFSAVARRDDLIDHLQHITLFAACSRKDLQKVARRSENMRVPAGKTIVTEGDDANAFFVILDGTARVSRRGPKDRDPRARERLR